MASTPALVSPRFDFGWFVLPGIVAAMAAVGIAELTPGPAPTGMWLWITGVLLVDVAHVYASLYRTYLDPEAWVHHRHRMIVTPIACLWGGFLLHLQAPLLFWSVLAYVAIFHFIKQHVGFALLYVRAGNESHLDRRLVTAAIWSGTAGPVVWWHANLPTEFAWFMDGDLVSGLPGWVGDAALGATIPVWIAFFARRAMLRARGHRNPLLLWLTLIPTASWYLGIVVYDDDRVFTLTNVFLHGVPYLALVWVAGGRDRVGRGLERLRTARATIPLIVAYYGLLLVLAVSEEALWDRLVWHDRAVLFGEGWTLQPGGTVEALVVAVLTVPQATHYLLDRWIWRVGPDNPQLAEQLGFGYAPQPATGGPPTGD